MQSTNSPNPENGETPAWLRPSITAIVIQAILAAAVPMAFGIVAFCMIHHWARWIFLAGGSFMAFVGCGGILLYISWRSRQHEKSCVATETSARPKPFSLSSMQFDHNPADADLTCLLAAPRSLGMSDFKIIEKDGKLRVIPTQLPIIGIMASMVLGGVILTAVPMFLRSPILPGESSTLFDVLSGIWVASIWLVLIPFWAVVLAVVNRQIAKTDDFLRVDTTKRILELCHEARTLRAADIVAFTELTRWVHGAEGWGKTLQTGVLVRTANGGIVLLALADGGSHLRLAYRLASIFHVPVRRIELSRSESRALNDC
jgi:hypothetical protein